MILCLGCCLLVKFALPLLFMFVFTMGGKRSIGKRDLNSLMDMSGEKKILPKVIQNKRRKKIENCTTSTMPILLIEITSIAEN